MASDNSKKTAPKRGDSKKPVAKKPVSKGKKPAPKAASKKSGSKSASRKSGSKKGGAVVKRHFSIYYPDSGESKYRYAGTTPKQAASKSFTQETRRIEKRTGKKVTKPMDIVIRETTRGRIKKLYGYTAVKNKIKNPTKHNINGSEIIYQYRNSVNKKPLDQIPSLVQSGGLVKKKADKKKVSKSGSKSKAPKSKNTTTKSKTTKPTKKTGSKKVSKK
jgi:hypothetical protein